MRSSANRMVARKARQSREHEPVQGSSSQLEFARGVWLVYSTKPDRSGTTAVTKSLVGLAWSLHRVHGVCGSSPQNHWVSWLSHKAKTRGSVGRDRIRVRRETSKQRTRVRIARLASRLSEVRSSGIRPMVLRREFPKCPSGGCILILCNRGSFVFRLPPYKLRGERMATTSWNTSSSAFLFSLPIFLRSFYRTSLRASWRDLDRRMDVEEAS
jgi:hypothetical protein